MMEGMPSLSVQGLGVAAAAGPARVRVALGALVAVVALGVVLTGADDGFGFEATITAPILLAAGLLTVAGALAATAALTSPDRTAAPRLLALAGVLGVLAAVHLDVRSVPLPLELGLALAVVGFGVLRRSRDLVLAGVLLLASPAWQELDAFATAELSWLLAAAGAVLACSALTGRAGGTIEELAVAAVAFVRAFDPRQVAIAVGAGIVVLGAAGLAYDVGAVSRDALDLNAEQTPAAAYSSLLLLAAAGVAFVLALALTDHADRRSWALLAGVLGFLALDEIALVHEAIQEEVGVKGQIVLAPVALVGLVAWLGIMRAPDTGSTAQRLLVGGAGCWAFAQLLDVGQDPEKDRMMYTVVPEEILEMIGSALFLFAAVVVVRELAAERVRSVRVAAEPAPAVPRPAPVH